MWPGINSLAEFAIPMIGLSSSSGKQPIALKRLLWGAFSSPFFILSDLIVASYCSYKKPTAEPMVLYKISTHNRTMQ
jgi:hypothetical protein